MKRTVINAVLAVCLVILIGCGYVLFNWYGDVTKAQKAFKEVQGKDAHELWEKNHDIVGWLRIPGTKVSYPVMQRGTEYYLHRDFNRRYSASGCLFADSDSDIENGCNVLIFGHHMWDGSMFGRLVWYSNYNYYQAHRYIEFDVYHDEGRQVEHRVYKVFSVFPSSENDKKSYMDFASIEDEDTYGQYISYVTAKSVQSADMETPHYPRQLITLSTCSYHLRLANGMIDHSGRYAVVAVRIS